MILYMMCLRADPEIPMFVDGGKGFPGFCQDISLESLGDPSFVTAMERWRIAAMSQGDRGGSVIICPLGTRYLQIYKSTDRYQES